MQLIALDLRCAPLRMNVVSFSLFYFSVFYKSFVTTTLCLLKEAHKKRHKFHKFAKIMQFTLFCRDFDLVAKYAFSQAPSSTNFPQPGSTSDSRTGGGQGQVLRLWRSLVKGGSAGGRQETKSEEGAPLCL